MAGDTRDTGGGDAGVGYGRPPQATRFRKGQSGNPAGKRKGTRNRPDAFGERLRALLFKEAYRPFKVKVGAREITMPLAQAALRSLTDAAAKGEPRALAAFFKMLSAGEAEAAALRAMLEEERELEAPELEVHIVDVVDGKPVPTGKVIYPDGGGPEEEGGKEM